MDDRQITHHIDELVDEEHRLRTQAQSEGVSREEQQRLTEIEIELDKAWDLLRQRRARREMGQDPDFSAERGAGTVEGYRQ